jgi:hypothetical protein
VVRRFGGRAGALDLSNLIATPKAPRSLYHDAVKLELMRKAKID